MHPTLNCLNIVHVYSMLSSTWLRQCRKAAEKSPLCRYSSHRLASSSRTATSYSASAAVQRGSSGLSALAGCTCFDSACE